jgi:hypothetical protein
VRRPTRQQRRYAARVVERRPEVFSLSETTRRA